jgi:hypothetical protein
LSFCNRVASTCSQPVRSLKFPKNFLGFEGKITFQNLPTWSWFGLQDVTLGGEVKRERRWRAYDERDSRDKVDDRRERALVVPT